MKRGQKAPADPLLEAMRLACADEPSAVAFLEARRWGGAPACMRCGDVNVYQMRDAKTGTRNKDFRWRCRGCKKMFSVRTGTVLEESRLALSVWVFAFWSACASKKGVSALQISRECRISYKSALFLMHRIRHAMADLSPDRPKLTGTVEADETYVGGKPRHKGTGFKTRADRKSPVIAVVERGGDLRMRALTSTVKAADIQSAVLDNVDASARLITDESPAYTAIGRKFEGGHETVNHGWKEYVRGDVHSNTIEGAFSLLKRGMYGTFHSVSKKHLHRYVAEFEFRHNARKISDAERADRAIKGADGKRLTHKQQVAG